MEDGYKPSVHLSQRDVIDTTNNTTTKTSDNPSVWRMSFYLTLAVLSFLYLTMTIILFYTRRTHIADIRYRPLRLNILNTVATIMLCVMFCLRTAFWPGQFPCVLIFWSAYLGFFLWCTTVACRVLSFAWVGRFNLAKIRMSKHYGDVNFSSFSSAAPQTPTTPLSHNEKKLGIRGGSAALLKRFRRLKHCATDKWLARRVLYPVMVLGLILCLVLQFTAPGVSVKPLRTECELGIEAIPLLVLLGFFLAIICPFLGYLLYDIQDAYGVKKELIVAILGGNVAYIGFFVIEKALPGIQDYFGSYVFAWIAFMICHTLSITLPVLRSFEKKRTNVGATLSRMSSYGSQVSVIKSRKYGHFLEVLGNPALFAKYKECTAACFCVELSLFIEEYQFLEFLMSLYNSQETRKSTLMAPQMTHTQDSTRNSLIYPYTNGFTSTKSTILPHELREEFNTFYHMFFDANSDLAINFRGTTLAAVKNDIENGTFDMSIFSVARDEVMGLLYRNTFDKFLKMYGDQEILNP